MSEATKTKSDSGKPGYVYVQDAGHLADLTEKLRSARRIGLDTEADSLHHYFEKVCLIQLSFSGNHYIVDPLAGLALADFFDELSRKEMVLQGADYDLRMLKKTFGFRPKAPVFDTMLAAQVLGYEKISLAALAEKFCGVSLSKSGQTSDWAKRPLPVRLLDYASDDTRYLEEIADQQTAELRELGREAWHRECCERVVETSGLPPKNDEKEAWRVKGASKLSPKELAFLRELWTWRDDTARKKDRPPFMILHNEDLIELARWCADHAQTPLGNGPAFVKRISGDNLIRLENAVRSAEGLSSDKWPVSLKKVRPQEDPALQKKTEMLMSACKAVAGHLKIEPWFLASRAALTNVALQRPGSVEEVMASGNLMRWQAECLMPAIRNMLES